MRRRARQARRVQRADMASRRWLTGGWAAGEPEERMGALCAPRSGFYRPECAERVLNGTSDAAHPGISSSTRAGPDAALQAPSACAEAGPSCSLGATFGASLRSGSYFWSCTAARGPPPALCCRAPPPSPAKWPVGGAPHAAQCASTQYRHHHTTPEAVVHQINKLLHSSPPSPACFRGNSAGHRSVRERHRCM